MVRLGAHLLCSRLPVDRLSAHHRGDRAHGGGQHRPLVQARRLVPQRELGLHPLCSQGAGVLVPEREALGLLRARPPELCRRNRQPELCDVVEVAERVHLRVHEGEVGKGRDEALGVGLGFDRNVASAIEVPIV